MSYSNDWSISGISGLTSLKDCYQWNGEKRLNNFIFLRRHSVEPQGQTGTSIIYSNPGYIPVAMKNNGDLSLVRRQGGKWGHYIIPGFLIGNDNIEALGCFSTNWSNESNGFHHNQMHYYDTTYSPSTAKNWRYLGYYPIIISYLENFSHDNSYALTDLPSIYHTDDNKIAYWTGTTGDSSCIIQSTDTIFGIVLYRYHHYGFEIDQSLSVTSSNTFASNILTAHRTYDVKGSYSATISQITHWIDFNNDIVLSNVSDMLFFKSTDYYSFDEISSEMSTIKDIMINRNPYKITAKTDIEVKGAVNVERFIPWYTTSSWSVNIPSSITGEQNIDIPSLVMSGADCKININTTSQIKLPILFSANKYIYSSLNIDDSWTTQTSSDYIGVAYKSIGPVLADLKYYYQLDDSNHFDIFQPSTSFFSCPVVLTKSSQTLIFQPQWDQRINGWGYRVYVGSFSASYDRTGGTISFKVFTPNGPENVTLSITDDSDGDSTLISTGGRIWWDGINHTAGKPGCLSYQQDPTDYTLSHWENFGLSVDLKPISIPTWYTSATSSERRYGWTNNLSRVIYGKMSLFYYNSVHDLCYSQDSNIVTIPANSNHYISTSLTTIPVWSELKWGFNNYGESDLKYSTTWGTKPDTSWVNGAFENSKRRATVGLVSFGAEGSFWYNIYQPTYDISKSGMYNFSFDDSFTGSVALESWDDGTNSWRLVAYLSYVKGSASSTISLNRIDLIQTSHSGSTSTYSFSDTYYFRTAKFLVATPTIHTYTKVNESDSNYNPMNLTDEDTGESEYAAYYTINETVTANTIVVTFGDGTYSLTIGSDRYTTIKYNTTSGGGATSEYYMVYDKTLNRICYYMTYSSNEDSYSDYLSFTITEIYSY